ncbi:MAG: hypothetical protein WA061_01675 [Microgenomates group bacterium]
MDAKLEEYRRAYEKANGKKLEIKIEEDYFWIDGLPHKLSDMTTMTQRLLDRIERKSKGEDKC